MKPRYFTKILKVKSVYLESVLISRNENTGPVTRDHVKFSSVRNETPLQL